MTTNGTREKQETFLARGKRVEREAKRLAAITLLRELSRDQAKENTELGCVRLATEFADHAFFHCALHRNVMCVLSIHIGPGDGSEPREMVGQWKAYNGTVPGMSHNLEWRRLAEEGQMAPIEPAMAKLLWPSVIDLLAAARFTPRR